MDIVPLDHYVSQVHLRRFYSPALGNRMYAIRKTDLKAFTPDAESVCRIMGGSTNAYLQETRAIEDFLKTIEPNYNQSVDNLIAGTVNRDSIYVIAGFIAYVMTCSPAGMRIFSGPLKSTIETTTAMMDARGELPSPPAAIRGSSLTDLIRRGTIKIAIDPKYPQALGITAILEHTAQFGNFHWELLRNERAARPFFTSDFPVAMEKTNDFRVFNRIVPLAPNLAVRIRPDITWVRRRGNPDFSFRNFRYRYQTPKHADIVRVNRLIVRCAEETVFYRDNAPWVRPFVVKDRLYRIEPRTQKIPTPTGVLHFFTHEVTSNRP